MTQQTTQRMVDLEAAIDDAGRDCVFAIMREAGWGPQDAPPEWVWRDAIATALRLLGKGE